MPGPNQANLRQALLNISNQIQEMSVNPKPSYGVDGISVSWGEHFNNLQKAMKDIRVLIQEDDGPFEVITGAR